MIVCKGEMFFNISSFEKHAGSAAKRPSDCHRDTAQSHYPDAVHSRGEHFQGKPNLWCARAGLKFPADFCFAVKMLDENRKQANNEF